MKRHPALVPLSHDHHHGLVQARRLRRAADEADPERRLATAGEFVGFFAREGSEHFREDLSVHLVRPGLQIARRTS